MSRPSKTSTSAPRILIVRLSAIGDVVQGMPIACALRERFPQSYLAWAVGEAGATLLTGHQALDEIIVLPRRWLRSPRTFCRVRRRLRASRFDVAVEAQGLTKAALVAWLSAAPRRIGFGNPWGRELSRWLNTETVDTSDVEHVVDRNLRLLRPLGIESPRVRFQLPELPQDRAAAEQMIARLEVGPRFALVNSGAGWPSKLWPSDRYASVASHLGRRWQLPTIVVWGRDEERLAGQQIVAASGGHARLAPPTTLPQLAALARRARLFLGSYTGPLHIAAAAGTPCVGLFGPWPARRHGPYGPNHLALQAEGFEGTTRQRRNAPARLMQAIRVADVCQACDQILQRDGREAA